MVARASPGELPHCNGKMSWCSDPVGSVAQGKAGESSALLPEHGGGASIATQAC